MAAILQIDKLSKQYADGTAALHDVTFSLEPGEFVAVIGPSGAGKSTLLRCINRLVEPTEGSVLFDDIHSDKANRRQVQQLRRQVGMIFQGYNLVERVSVLHNVLHGRLGYMDPIRGALGLFSNHDKQEAKALLVRLGLEQQIYKRADELSGGQQQRVGIARALCQKPKLMLADEPIASLDPLTSKVIMDYLYRICREDGIACMVNLHQVDVAKSYATRIIGMHKGKIVFNGRPDELTDEAIAHIYGGSPVKE
ncbi:phosphonate ABC transporter ATP-binding protein [Paenibacillus lycopersici]|uniref:Phosphonate ABC transporter ATP-binding protein n=1 Tax=Paenibacillus lycopersici TaxID=2704462 RepID=A0A6C0G0L8_9BACL|nr:phosphonate ABC transporter ATP-binding protein [Paenibacillus lycopersici]QHT62936.1 phosphonate ABC transporter ATP-binding protein [Paenibacillus lycopersici]